MLHRLSPRGRRIGSAISYLASQSVDQIKPAHIVGQRPLHSNPTVMFSSLNPLPHLPKYKGPYKVGSSEYEIPVSEIPSATEIPDSTIDTIKFRVYYPTTQSASSRRSIPWLPEPQKEWNRAYGKFLGFSDRSSSVMANVPSMLNYATIPAVQNAPLLEMLDSKPWPVVIFSHGLGGNFNTYSSFVGSLASCGIVVVAPEHRDQSAPISFIRSSPEKAARPVLYRKYSHKPTVEVLNGRNAMLRIRMWELEQLYSSIEAMNSGKIFTNLADQVAETSPIFKQAMDLTPSRVTWAGHSFGAASVVQFVKSVYHRQHAPSRSKDTGSDNQGWDWTPLYTPAENHSLTKQITSASPMVLLDLWAMPLTSQTTNWLWERPLPCYDREVTDPKESTSPNVVSIMSNQFYKWPELVHRTKALLSANPVEAYQILTQHSGKHIADNGPEEDEEPQAELSLDPITRLETSKGPYNTSDSTNPTSPSTPNLTKSDADKDLKLTLPPPSETSTRTPSPARSTQSSQIHADTIPSPSSSTSSLPTSTTPPPPHLYYVPTSAHLSQSDFGLLFPNLTKYLLKTNEPADIMDLNVQATLSMMRGNGINVADLQSKVEMKDILTGGGGLQGRWERLDVPGLH